MKNYLFGLVGMLVGMAHASACSFPISSLEKQVEKADEIFIATLLEAKLIPKDARHEWPQIEGRFKISKTLKGGGQPEEITLTTGLGRSDCGIGMMVSWKYLILKGRNESGIWAPTGTHVIEDFQEDEFATNIQAIVRRQENKRKTK